MFFLCLGWRISGLLAQHRLDPAEGGGGAEGASQAALVCGLFVLMLLYLAVDLAAASERLSALAHRVKIALILIAVAISIVAPCAYRIKQRIGPAGFFANGHDGGVWYAEIAAEKLLEGANPYSIDYHANRLGLRTVDRHYPYGPLTFLSAAVGVGVLKPLLGSYDQRIVYLLCLACIGVACLVLGRTPGTRRMLLITMLLNPLAAAYVVNGENDLLPVCLLVMALVLAQRRKDAAASVVMGLALATKQYALFVCIAWLAFLLLQRHREAPLRERVSRWVMSGLLPCGIAAVVPYIPFFLWSPHDFLDDLVLFPMGLSGDGTGVIAAEWVIWGLGRVLVLSGLVQDPGGPMPTWVTALMLLTGVLGAVVTVVAVSSSRRRGLQLVPAAGGAYMMAIMFFGRWFTITHVSVGLWLLFLGCFADGLAEDSPGDRSTSEDALQD